MVGLVAVGDPEEKRDPALARAHQVHHELPEVGAVLARVAVGYADLLGLVLLLFSSFGFVVAAAAVTAVEVERGGVEMDALRLRETEALRGLARDPHEHLGEAGLEELIQDPPQPVVV